MTKTRTTEHKALLLAVAVGWLPEETVVMPQAVETEERAVGFNHFTH